MAAGGAFGADVIPHVDGGLFDDDAALDLDSESRRILAEVSRLDWSAIKPSILGTLFERSLDPGKRSQLGAHYTGEEDILLIVEPVLMAPLRRRWGEIKAEVKAKAEKRDLIAGSRPSPQKTRQLAKIEAELFGLLRGFRAELAAIQVLDAACGSGNFLYVSLRLLLDLEKEVITLAAALGDSLAFPMVSPKQLHGIEINPYAYELAQTTIWIGYIQWWRDNGFGLPEEPILKPLEAIRQMDAILDLTGFEGGAPQAEGDAPKPVRSSPVEPEWPEADVIVGNPPFLGDKKMRAELGDKYVDDLFGRCMRAGAGRGRPGDAIGSRRRGRRLRRGRRSGQGCWRRKASAAGPTARFWSESRRPAISSGRSPIGIGCWMAQRCMSRWWGLMVATRRQRELDGRPVAHDQLRPDCRCRCNASAPAAGEPGTLLHGRDAKAGPFDIDAADKRTANA